MHLARSRRAHPPTPYHRRVPVIAATNIRHSFGVDVVLDGVSLAVEPGERAGLVGRNGTGKSTLMRILAGEIAPDAGTVSIQRGSRVGYLRQDPALDPDESLRDAAEGAFAELHALHAELHAVFDAMGSGEGDALTKLLNRQADLERRIDHAGGYAVDHRIDETLHGLGFTNAQFSIRVGDLSGGQRARLALARLLLEDPDVLLLDEPTNHLDLDGRIWLETFLRENYHGAVVLISHDRYLLDRVVSRIIETEDGRTIEYPGDYTTFRQLRGERRLAQLRAFERQQTAFRREEAFIRKYKAGQRAKQARGRESRLERAREEAIERPAEHAELSLRLPRAERSGEIVATARGITKEYPGDDGSTKTLFRGLELKIGRGERWGVIGPNGAGKTTLVRTLLGEVRPDAGSVSLGSNVRAGYFRQDQEDADPELPVYRYLQNRIRAENPDKLLSEQDARNLAGAFLFSGSDQDKTIGVLSGGERTRAAIAGLLASAKNVLVLDEPTNHLDIPSAERLEESLALDGGYDGTLILISHDRALIDATCDHLLVLDGCGGCKVMVGTYTENAERIAAMREAGSEGWETGKFHAAPTSASEISNLKSQISEPRQGHSPTAANADTRRTNDDVTRTKSRFSWMRIEQLEERMGELEADIGDLDEELGRTETWSDAALTGRLTDERAKLRSELEELEDEWLRRAQ